MSRSKLCSPKISQPASSNRSEDLFCTDPLREGVELTSAEPPVTTRGRLNSLFSGAFPGKFSCIRSACSARRPLPGQINAHSARIHIIDRVASIYCKTSKVPGRNRASTKWFWLGSRRMSTPRSAASRHRLHRCRHHAQCSAWVVPCTCSPHHPYTPPVGAAAALTPPSSAAAELPKFGSRRCQTCRTRPEAPPPYQSRPRITDVQTADHHILHL